MNTAGFLLFGYANFFMELGIAAMLFVWFQPKRKWFWLRLVGCASVSFGAFYFLPSVKVLSISLNYFIIAVVVAAELFFLFKIKWFTVIFYTVAAFILQHLSWSILMFIFDNAPELSRAMRNVIYFALYAVIYVAVSFVFPRKSLVSTAVKPNIINLSVCTVSIMLIYIISLRIGAEGLWNNYCRLYDIMFCLIALLSQSGIFRITSLKNENETIAYEKDVLEKLLQQSGKQQELTKNTIETIEMKCHDMKHQLSVLMSMNDEEKHEQIKKLESVLNVYGDIAKTGNRALDIVLTEKTLFCESRHIKFTYIADGGALECMDSIEISCLFGNILDNAIECVCKEEEAYRIIRLHVSSERSCLKIGCENYCSHAVTFRNGLPVSDKGDDVRHGFGVKSIRYITEKNNGNLVMRQEKNLFNVNIIIPFAQTK